MFRKIVSAVSLSPALIGKLADYAADLRLKQHLRGVGLIAISLAMVAHIGIVLHPATPSNASHRNDLVYGGVNSLEDFLAHYDADDHGLRQIIEGIGLSRSDIGNAEPYADSPDIATVSVSRHPLIGTADGESRYQHESRVFYARPVPEQLFVDGWAGVSANGAWFGIMKQSGIVVVEGSHGFTAQGLPAQADITAVNVSQGGVDAETTRAQPGDRVAYTIKTSVTQGDLQLPITDILEYADIVDGGGSFFDTTNQTLTWFNIATPASETTTRTFTVKIMDSIPLTAQGVSNTSSFDCIVSAVSNNAVHITIVCPPLKQLELAIKGLPTISRVLSLSITGGLLLLSLYLYTRSRQLHKEIRIIRTKINTGVFS